MDGDKGWLILLYVPLFSLFGHGSPGSHKPDEESCHKLAACRQQIDQILEV
ncbi:MAG TPA: hypothetical protein VFV38_34455 [Ktedonobacteraceae bacterium]|nr:hypothetical protein [Ktedonobacteraceae bacterium]